MNNDYHIGQTEIGKPLHLPVQNFYIKFDQKFSDYT